MFSWGCFEIPTPKTLENIQKNVFSAVLIPDWKLLCRYFSGSAQKRKDIPRFRNFPEAFINVCLFLLRYRLACKATKLFPVSFFRKESKWRHFIKVAGLLLRFTCTGVFQKKVLLEISRNLQFAILTPNNFLKCLDWSL